ncbi:MAG: cobalt-precorrin 5A hydrolase [Coriobacteriales bacterium]|jgi:cobalt-precorrin 5A hydrolase|nr:cobalt-precorrin 5A hydrolase [Coriobacteriales bacterium]
MPEASGRHIGQESGQESTQAAQELPRVSFPRVSQGLQQASLSQAPQVSPAQTLGPEAFLMAFTEKGEQLAQRIAGQLSQTGQYASVSALRVTKLKESTAEVFKTGNVLIFVGAMGIAIRAIAPLVKSKTTDPAVIVIDEAGQFVISVLSGHLGGANHYSREIAGLIQATPVITTATDVQGLFSVDDFARQNGYVVLNPKSIKLVSAALLEGRQVGLSSDFEVKGQLPELLRLKTEGYCEKPDTGLSSDGKLSSDTKRFDDTKRSEDEQSGSDSGRLDLGIHIGLNPESRPFKQTLTLIPKCFHVGLGARKGIDPEALEQFFLQILSELGLPWQAVASLSSVDLKKEEGAILALAKKYRIPFITYPATELDLVAADFQQSEFVQSITGTGNICETSAYLSSGRGEMVLSKTTGQGMTIAVARQHWELRF